MYIPPEYLSRGIRYIRPDLIPVRRTARAKERYDHVLDQDPQNGQGASEDWGVDAKENMQTSPYPVNPHHIVRPDHPEDIPGGHLLTPDLEVNALLIAQEDKNKRQSALRKNLEEDKNRRTWHGPVLDDNLSFKELTALLKSVEL